MLCACTWPFGHIVLEASYTSLFSSSQIVCIDSGGGVHRAGIAYLCRPLCAKLEASACVNSFEALKGLQSLHVHARS